jgi:Ser-tRNA(Ala) deacylase AlaX
MACLKVFWQDPYLTTLESVVTSVNGDVVTLDKTIFYAFSGGQQSDSGTIEGLPILDAKKDNLEIFYTLPNGHGLQIGDHVHQNIDWVKRYKLMKLHFAAELVLELVYQNYGHPEKVGANITEDKARVDFRWAGNISSIFPELLPKVQDLINRNLMIISAFSDASSESRYWEIEGFAKVPCGGTHLKRTGEIGAIKFKRNNIGGGKERIEILLT